MSVPLVIGIYGSGPRAEACAQTVELSPALTAGIRVEATSADGLHDAIRRGRANAWAVALGPRESSQAVHVLVDTSTRAVILGTPRSPLGDALGSAHPAPTDPQIVLTPHVRIAHGWVMLRGCSALVGRGHINGELALRGLADGHPADRIDLVAEAVAVALGLIPGARFVEVNGTGDRFVLRADGGELRVTVTEGEPRLTASLEVGGQAIEWLATETEETIGGRRYRTHPFVERALAQLLAPTTAPGAGDGIAELLEVQALVEEIRHAAPALATPGLGALAAAPVVAGLLGALGLISPKGTTGGAGPPELTPPTIESLELVAFRAGVKPVLFLTVPPEEEATIRSRLGEDVHIERHLRRVARDARDRWTDDRQSGEPAVELFVSHDPGLAKKTAALQLADPTRHAEEIGDLLGYPRCCVEAFAAQTGRADNSYDRLQVAARTERRDRWPWELNDLAFKVVPFYPCRYDCPAALDLARGVLGALDSDLRARVETFLARSVLYFHDGEQLWLDGQADRQTVRFTALEARGPGARSLGACLAETQADALQLEAFSLIGTAASREVLSLRRTDPGLGFIAPFA